MQRYNKNAKQSAQYPKNVPKEGLQAFNFTTEGTAFTTGIMSATYSRNEKASKGNPDYMQRFYLKHAEFFEITCRGNNVRRKPSICDRHKLIENRCKADSEET